MLLFKKKKSNMLIFGINVGMVYYYRVIGLVPISDKNSVIAGRIWEGNGNARSAKDPYSSKPTGCFVECKGREIVKATNLILHLKNVCKVLPRRNRASCSIYTIFKWIPPVLNSIPILAAEKKKNKLQEFLLHLKKQSNLISQCANSQFLKM